MATTPKLISTKKVRTFSNKDNTKAIKLSQTTKDTGSKACVSFAYGYKALASDWGFTWTKLQVPNNAAENEQAVTCMEVAWLDHDNYLIIGTHTSLLYCGTTHVLTLPTFIVSKGYEYRSLYNLSQHEHPQDARARVNMSERQRLDPGFQFQGLRYTANTLNPAESSLTSYAHNTIDEDGSVITQERYKFVALYECEKGFDPEENNFYRTYHYDKPPEPDWSAAAAPE